MYFFLKYLVTLFYKKLRIKIIVSFLCESQKNHNNNNPVIIIVLLTSSCEYGEFW